MAKQASYVVRKCIKNEKGIVKPIKNEVINTAWAYERLTSNKLPSPHSSANDL